METPGRCQRVRRAAPVVLGCWMAVLAFTPAMSYAADAASDAATAASDEDDPANPFRPGVVAKFAGSDGKGHARLAETVWIASDGRPVDRRLPPGPFSATFRGQLLVQTPGVHRLWAHGVGQVEIRLAGQKLVDTKRDERGWSEGRRRVPWLRSWPR